MMQASFPPGGLSPEDYLARKFPEMDRNQRKPSVASFCGCGTRWLGRRGFDEKTQTFASTVCVTLFFLPLLPLAAYRILPAGPSRTHVFGRVPLGKAAKAMMIWLPLTLVALVVALMVLH